MAKESKEINKTEGKRLCQYEYKSEEFKGGQCPHQAQYFNDEKEKKISVCFWHWKEDEKDIYDTHREDFSNLDLREAYLRKAYLNGANLSGSNLQEADLSYASLYDTHLGWTDFTKAILIGSDLRESKFNLATKLHQVELFNCRLENSTLRYAIRNLDKILIDEIRKSYGRAKEVYRNLKNYFHQEGLYDESGEFYYREKLMEKKLYKQNKRWGKWIGNNIYHYLAGYGEHPLWVLVWWGIIILFFGTVYWVSHGLIMHGKNVTNPLDSYYFSVVTFTTLGFGDIQPNPSMASIKLCAMAEAVIGAFMMALFVLTFGRKMIR